MSKTGYINVRVDPVTKEKAESLYSTFGMTLSEAINIFLHQSILEEGIPFAIRMPRLNADTLAAIKEADDIIEGRRPSKGYLSFKDMVADIDAEDDDA